MASPISTIQPPGGPMKTWKRDLLDHLVFLVLRNAESPPSEDQVRDELKREFRPYLRAAAQQFSASHRSLTERLLQKPWRKRDES